MVSGAIVCFSSWFLVSNMGTSFAMELSHFNKRYLILSKRVLWTSRTIIVSSALWHHSAEYSTSWSFGNTISSLEVSWATRGSKLHCNRQDVSYAGAAIIYCKKQLDLLLWWTKLTIWYAPYSPETSQWCDLSSFEFWIGPSYMCEWWSLYAMLATTWSALGPLFLRTYEFLLVIPLWMDSWGKCYMIDYDSNPHSLLLLFIRIVRKASPIIPKSGQLCKNKLLLHPPVPFTTK